MHITPLHKGRGRPPQAAGGGALIMANFYTDHPEYEFYLNHPEMQRVVELKERNYADKEKYEDAPVDFEDAIEN